MKIDLSNTSGLMYTVIYKVSGRGEFPIDMLRVDRSCPYSEIDANTIKKSELRSVSLFHIGQDKNWTPNREKWSSYDWLVIAKLPI